MAGPISTGNFAAALWPGINSWYGGAYSEVPEVWNRIFEVRQSDKAYEEIYGLSSFGLAPVKAQGQGIEYDSEQRGFLTRFQNVVYALGFQVTYEEFQDNLYAQVGRQRARRLAFSMRTTKEVVHANIINRGYNAAQAGGDGVSLFNSAHPNVAGGTFSNILATAADLSEAALEQACIDISKFTNDRGLNIFVMPRALLIPPDLEFEATRILKSIQQNDTANNAVNALRDLGKIPDGVMTSVYLNADADQWQLLNRNVPDGLISFQREESFAPSEDNDFDTMNAKYRSYMRFVPYWADPRCVFGSPGA
jgi:hypothetical protein